MNTRDSGTIRVADITLAQLSRGMYRSIATAYKELISNAFDADASEVYINTNSPEFDYFSCSDNGTGMPIDKFLKHFKDDGIGSSIKRKRSIELTNLYNRPIIGKLGIGMMAAGQLCHSFNIESHYTKKDGKGEAYQAEIVLEDVNVQSKENQITNYRLNQKEIEVGKWNYEMVEYDERKKGFHIYSDDVRATLRRDLKKSILENDLKNFHFDLSRLNEYYYDKSNKSIRDCQQYLEMIWELSMICPLPYYGKISEYPIEFSKLDHKHENIEDKLNTEKFLKSRQERLKKYNFKLFFDGIELFKLVKLPTSDNTVNEVYFIDQDEFVFKDRLKYSGYIFTQIPKAITPLELNGIQIRVKGVGIGGYDSTFLKYYKNIETVSNRWVSGEIFVDYGLESALNIDRDSFNEHDEHYKKLQNNIHEILDRIFSNSKSISKKLSDKRKEIKSEELKKKFACIVKEVSNNKYKLKFESLGDYNNAVKIDTKHQTIVLNESFKPIKRKKSDEIYRIVSLAYEMSKLLQNTNIERDKLFNRLLATVIEELI